MTVVSDRPAGTRGAVGHSPRLPSLDLVPSSRFARRVARLLAVLLVVGAVGLVFVPWQQTVSGTGRVVAFAPLERQQVVQAPIKGRIKSWGPSIREGVFVRRGDVVLELQDNDPQLRERYALMVQFIEEKVSNAREKAGQYERYVKSFVEAAESTVESAREMVRESEQELAAKRQDLAAAQASELQKSLNVSRQQELFEAGGLTSKYKLEVAVREHAEAVSKTSACRSYVAAAEAKVRSKEADLAKKDQEARAKVSGAEADLRTARGDLASYGKELADSSSSLAKLDQFVVTAPADGYVLHLAAFQGGEYVKEGDPLFTLVPEANRLAAEIWLSGNDVPLVSAGRHVRLQFEGWPAVQFSGWPSVAVGTFGGEVTTIDSTDDGTGRFRILVTTDEEHPWPEAPYLRQGARTNGWVLLDQVPLGYEVWRRLNGFPPTVAMDKDKDGGKDGGKDDKKPGKPPKPKT